MRPPCSKLCEPPIEEGVEEVDVDDNIDEGKSVADKVGKGVPGKSFGILPFFAILLGLAFNNKNDRNSLFEDSARTDVSVCICLCLL